MKNVLPFLLFENEDKEIYQFDELSPEAKENATQNVREEMWEGNYGAYDIPEWAVDDDYLFEPIHDEMVEVFGPDYNDDLGQNPMIANDRKEISFVGKPIQIIISTVPMQLISLTMKCFLVGWVYLLFSGMD